MTPLLLLLWRGLLGQCPNCGQVPMFRGIFRLQDHCTHCGIVYENQPGDYLGAVHISATVVSGLAMVLGVLTIMMTDSVLLTVLIDVPIILILCVGIHRLIKSIWTAMLVYTLALEAPRDDDFWY